MLRKYEFYFSDETIQNLDKIIEINNKLPYNDGVPITRKEMIELLIIGECMKEKVIS